MPFVVTESCIGCKHTDCVTVCPMGCFFEGPNFVVIHPDECIDCSMCVPECPVDAIIGEHELPEDQIHFVQINRTVAEDGRWPRITEARAPLPGHEDAARLQDKLHLLEDYESR